MGSSASSSSSYAPSSRASSGSHGYMAHTHVETDGPGGYKVEHHKDGHGRYSTQTSNNRNDGKVTEKRGDVTIREKNATTGSSDRVARSYNQSSGTYSLATDNCQHASSRAFDAA
mmetsp:Transcript_7091/g.17114  ORF Transcript_7091/g.17114 Transcript_7091/m.17114 type:complete len:115 (+) Transcript_7091:104-448(+)|eukprot:330833-Amphidinium_carterae.1